jgi:class 3 adenylate cyclase
MQCPDCQRENDAAAKFCGECGAKLARGCSACGSEVKPTARYCSACGARQGEREALPPAEVHEGAESFGSQVAQATPPDAERRHLTVMFSDLVGSTALAQRLDDEDLREVMRGYYDACAETVRRYEGYIANYLGDGLLVYFGYPRAHEDDSERAVRAALDMLAQLTGELNGKLEVERGHRLAARIGIHTGPVVVGDLGRGARGEAMALGETVNMAARLQTVAAPDAVVISAATRRLVRGIFVLEDLGPQRLKGIAEPVVAYRVLQPTGCEAGSTSARVRSHPSWGVNSSSGCSSTAGRGWRTGRDRRSWSSPIRVSGSPVSSTSCGRGWRMSHTPGLSAAARRTRSRVPFSR